MRRPRAVFASALAAFAAFAVSASAAGAAAPWSRPVDLSATSSGVDDVSLALNGGGSAVALWTQYAGMSGYVESALRAPGGPFGPAGIAVGPGAFAPDVAIAPSGEAIAVWSQSDGRNNRVWAAIRPAGGSFGRPAILSAANAGAGSAQVAMAPSGEAVAVWLRGGIAQAAIRPPGGAFGVVEDLSASGASDIDVDVAPSGEAVAAWSRFDAIGNRYGVQAAARLPGADFGGAFDLSAGGADAFGPAVAMDPAGNGTILWTRDGVVQARTHPAGRGFPAGTDEVSAPGETAREDVEAAADASGNVTAVWTGGSAVGVTPVQTATRPPGGAFGTSLPISGARAFLPQVAVAPSGAAVAAWREVTGGDVIARAATRPVGGVFGAAGDVSAAGPNLLGVDVAIDDEGSALAAWGYFDGRTWTAQTSYLDVEAPQLSGVSVPATGVIGVPVQVSAAAFDAWSPVSVAWSFGDGGSATGASASHVYGQPGTYTVTVTATDAAGRTASATRQVAIGAGVAITPLLSRLRVTPAAFRAAGSGPSASPSATRRGRARGRSRARARPGARVSFHVNLAGTVAFAVERQTRGRRVGGRCVRATRRNRRARACTRTVVVRGGFEYRTIAGEVGFAFSGRVGGRKLAPGRYLLAATPTGLGRTGATVRTPFRILRPAPARRRAPRR